MNKNDDTIRLEKKEDHRAVENLVREAFWNVYRLGCSEHYVIPVLTMGPIGIAPELIAEIGTPMIPEEQYAAIVNGGG